MHQWWLRNFNNQSYNCTLFFIFSKKKQNNFSSKFKTILITITIINLFLSSKNMNKAKLSLFVTCE